MFRVIDLDSLTLNQDAQTMFTFAVGTERHGIPATEMFELLKQRVAQNAAGKGANRKNGTQKRPANSEQTDTSEYQSTPQPSSEGGDELALSN